MGLWVPSNGFGWVFSSIGATRPAAAFGTTVTPGNNVMGSWSANVLTAANLSTDVFGLYININSNATSTANRSALLDVGVDPAGGTSYSVLIPQLIAGNASAFGAGGVPFGLNYYFPIWIKAGSTVACRATVNNATVGTLRVHMMAFGKPHDERTIQVGNKVFAYGTAIATSGGTAVTSGTTSEGSWTQVGTVGTNDRPWYWQWAANVNNSALTAVAYGCDLSIGSASAKQLVGERYFCGTSAELWWDNGVMPGYYRAAPGDLVYARLQCSGTVNTGTECAAWGME